MAWIGVAVLLAAALAGGLPLAARLVPWSAEHRLADALGGIPGAIECTRPAGRTQLATLVARIYPIYPEDAQFPVDVRVLRGHTVNAFAILGGKIYVYEGLLDQAQSAEELAGVLAHEIEHVRRRHILEGALVKLVTSEVFNWMVSGPGQMSPQMVNLLLGLRFGREQEKDADQGGLQRLKDAHVDVSGFKRFFERLASDSVVPTLISDHPASEDRALLADQYRPSQVEPVLATEGWRELRGICK